MDNGFLTVQQVSEYLQIKPATIYAKAEAGEVPYYKVGRLIRFKMDDIENWMDGQRREPIDVGKMARRTLGNGKYGTIDQIIKKSIEKVGAGEYIPNHGKPNQN